MIQSKIGLRFFRISVAVLPLIPMLILIIQSVFRVDDLIARGQNLTKFEDQVPTYIEILLESWTFSG